MTLSNVVKDKASLSYFLFFLSEVDTGMQVLGMSQELSDAELDTYSRQIALNNIDYSGQLKLRNAKACIIGFIQRSSTMGVKRVLEPCLYKVSPWHRILSP